MRGGDPQVSSLIAKYNVPGPRYTSYPTVPFWDGGGYSGQRWQSLVRRSFDETNASDGISVYVHLPFCETPCTFCGCIKKFTRDHSVEAPYLGAVLKEWALYREIFGARPRVRELHLGGGTPTFFAAENLRRLVDGLLRDAVVVPDHEFGFEANPGSTTVEHLQVLHDAGFRRLSLGIQDFDPVVQQTINRVQSVEQVAAVTNAAREVGYDSINFDLLYGLPRQRLDSVRDTVAEAIKLRPDRIAFYGYAHVPWIKGIAQRRFTEADIPRDAEKRALYELGRVLFLDAGYLEIGMDHFALPTDSLSRSSAAHTVHRNFMGYTAKHTQLSVGLGMSAIGDAWYAFSQNEKNAVDYARRVDAGELPLLRGHVLDEEDLRLRRHILELMCRFETHIDAGDSSAREGASRLDEMQRDGLVELTDDGVRITPEGRPFVRNVCMAFDARLWREKPRSQLFSSTI
jgi:oxygen-independent coproporphyrinogen-3 oxidase